MRKLTERTKLLKFTPFPCELLIVISSDVNASLKKRFPLQATRPYHALVGLIGGRSVMILPKNASIETITHETSHAVRNIEDFIGERQEEEFVAYYTGWIASEVTKLVLKKPGVDKKKKR